MVAITETETPKTEVKTEKTSMASRATNYLTSWIPTIPYTLDDLWALIEKLKANFSHGLFEGLEETLQDVILWVTSWQIWQNPSVQEWLQYFLELGNHPHPYVLSFVAVTSFSVRATLFTIWYITWRLRIKLMNLDN